ncbi:MAG TPA: SDR family oxidoreductase [Longilinea sp.]|nr:SDR family oxidoreductase [Longilinea sp.]
MNKNFDGKLVFITGGSSGIGLALAKQFASRGANVWIAARRTDLLDQAKLEIESFRKNPGQIIGVVQLDVADRQQIANMAKEFIGQNGAPDFLVNSAGVVHPGEFLRLDPERFDWMMNINYFGTVFTTRAFLPAMAARGSGHITNISSGAGYLGVYGYTAYCGSKFAVRGFSDALRSEIKNCGIGVTIVFPPDTNTAQLAYEEPFKPAITRELTQTSGLMQPDHLAQIVLSGIERGKYVITPGFMNSLYYFAVNLAGNGVYPIMDWMVRDARKKVGATNDKACECDLDDPNQV